MSSESISETENKKALWQDIVLYSALSLLLSSLFCYFIFSVKVYLQKKNIAELDVAISTVGSPKQKEEEKLVFSYKDKIFDFSKLIKEHKISSKIFEFLELEVLDSVWFNRFDMSVKDNKVSLEGETDNMEALSRQIDAFEKSENVKKVDILSSNIGESGKIIFRIALSLNPGLFAFLRDNLMGNF
jgi:hypothetical protein